MNPFLDGFVINVNEGISKTMFKLDADGNYVRFVSLYDSQRSVRAFVSKESRLKKMALGVNAMKLLVWIQEELDYSKSWVWIDAVRYRREAKVKSLTTLRTAINELVEAEFIERHEKTEQYWINPAYYFCGSRVKQFKDNLNVVTKKEMSLTELFEKQIEEEEKHGIIE